MTHDCDVHDDGSYVCYRHHGCRCLPCSVAGTDYARRLRSGGGNSRPAAPVARMIRQLQAEGWTQREIAAEAGLRRPTVTAIVNGYRDTVHRRTAEAIADVHDSLAFVIENVRVPVQPLLDALRVRQLSVQGTYGAADARALYRGRDAGWLSARVAERLASQLGHNLSTLWPHDEWEAA